MAKMSLPVKLACVCHVQCIFVPESNEQTNKMIGYVWACCATGPEAGPGPAGGAVCKARGAAGSRRRADAADRPAGRGRTRAGGRGRGPRRLPGPLQSRTRREDRTAAATADGAFCLSGDRFVAGVS